MKPDITVDTTIHTDQMARLQEVLAELKAEFCDHAQGIRYCMKCAKEMD